ncbi:MAG: 3-methyl-2-oxobutanoate hydroxymethyltransferase [Chloroflexota bacterium]|nr:3-methyl-2-oxobutanoate hydroxymethyltransferase [Chloroflexota bacterium]
MARKKITILDLQKKFEAGEPIAMITAYDYPSAILAEKAEVDIILVGDSLGMVVHGFETTLPVTMEMMLMHCAAVARGRSAAFLIGDMPFGSYEVSTEEAVRNATRFLQEGGVDAVKLEGGIEVADVVRAITRAGIPVQGHIGLTPQSVSKLGGFRVQGKSAASARRLLDDALALQEAGCFTIVLEAVPDRVAAAITERLSIPTIGIGAGPGCAGQVLVWHDMLGLFDRFLPKFARRFENAGEAIQRGLAAYVEQVRNRAFPASENSFTIEDEEWEAFQQGLAGGAEQTDEEIVLYGGA